MASKKKYKVYAQSIGGQSLLGDTWAVSAPQAINQVLYRVNGRMYRNPQTTYLAVEVGNESIN